MVFKSFFIVLFAFSFFAENALAGSPSVDICEANKDRFSNFLQDLNDTIVDYEGEAKNKIAEYAAANASQPQKEFTKGIDEIVDEAVQEELTIIIQKFTVLALYVPEIANQDKISYLLGTSFPDSPLSCIDRIILNAIYVKSVDRISVRGNQAVKNRA